MMLKKVPGFDHVKRFLKKILKFIPAFCACGSPPPFEGRFTAHHLCPPLSLQLAPRLVSLTKYSDDNYECICCLPSETTGCIVQVRRSAMATSSEVVDSSEKAVKKTQNEAGPSSLFAMYTYHANRYQNFTRIYCFIIDLNCFGPIQGELFDTCPIRLF